MLQSTRHSVFGSQQTFSSKDVVCDGEVKSKQLALDATYRRTDAESHFQKDFSKASYRCCNISNTTIIYCFSVLFLVSLMMSLFLLGWAMCQWALQSNQERTRHYLIANPKSHSVLIASFHAMRREWKRPVQTFQSRPFVAAKCTR